MQLLGLTAFELYVQGCRRAVKPSDYPNSRLKIRGEKGGMGPLVLGRPGYLDVPESLRYVVIQRAGDLMDDGHKVPVQPDGMACFMDQDGRYVLLRNHELGDPVFMNKYNYDMGHYKGGVVPSPNVNPSRYGGVSRAVLDPLQLAKDMQERPFLQSSSVRNSNMVLAGTDVNCAGGVVDGGWVSCEESSSPGHGYAFLTRPTDTELTAPRPIRSWGRFHREAVAIDEATGIVYMTEDRKDGCFYRHVPEDSRKPMGPGRLQALCIPDLPHSDPYPKPSKDGKFEKIWEDGQSWSVRWVDIPDPHAADLPCRQQAAKIGGTGFNRSEGIAWSPKGVWFLASTGGPLKGGQIFRLSPGAGESGADLLTLEMEIVDRTSLSCPDNIVMAPWGDMIMAEDNYDTLFGASYQFVRGMTPQGEVYDLLRNPNNKVPGHEPGAEFSGPCFSPDGRYFFINMQYPENVTLAVTGPWAD